VSAGLVGLAVGGGRRANQPPKTPAKQIGPNAYDRWCFNSQNNRAVRYRRATEAQCNTPGAGFASPTAPRLLEPKKPRSPKKRDLDQSGGSSELDERFFSNERTSNPPGWSGGIDRPTPWRYPASKLYTEFTNALLSDEDLAACRTLG